MQSGERGREANSFGVEASLPRKIAQEAGIPRLWLGMTVITDSWDDGFTSLFPDFLVCTLSDVERSAGPDAQAAPS